MSATWTAHEKAIARLKASYAAVPAGETVRLAKKTSNLFRARSATSVPGLDVSGLDGVLEVDAEAMTAQVQGMCTYEDLVAATLPHGLIPYVVPQLRTITLGGAVTGLGIESTSFRNGLPHESVIDMDVFTGSGEIVTVRPGDQLFDAFPNSYGSLGYATRLQIRLERVPAYAALQHLAFTGEDAAARAAEAMEQIVASGEHDGRRVDGLDGAAFTPTEVYLTLARWTDDATDGGRHSGPPSDYTRQQVFYRSIAERESDLLTMHDYLWRWDIDWFWCSAAFGAQHPLVRRVWPRRWRRSDVYHRLLGLDQRFGIADRLDRRAGRPQRERVVQDVEVPVERIAEFIDWFDAEVGMRPVWLCPLRTTRDWPAYPLEPGHTYVNAGFWGTVHVGEGAEDGPLNRAIEQFVHTLGGHKSLYSDAYYDRETFDDLYRGEHLAAVKAVHDPDSRFLTLYDKAVRRA